MPKGKYLNDAEKIQINLYHEEGYSNREIGRKINRSEYVIRHYLKCKENYGVKKPTKGNKKLTQRQINTIKKAATEQKLNATEIKTQLELPVTKNHISKILRSDINIRWRKPKSKPSLKECHKTARLQFARQYMHWTTEWKSVIFSDEKKFNLDGPDGYAYYWHDLRKNEVPMSKRNFGGGSVMVWGAFSAAGKAEICFVPPRMNSKIYTDLLEDALIPFLEDKMDEDCIFQQDNARIHVSAESKQWFKDSKISVMEWPALSPDLNPIENLWGYMAKKIYSDKCRGHQYNTVLELKLAIKEVWNSLDMNLLNNLVQSMPNRIFEVISKSGGPTKY